MSPCLTDSAIAEFVQGLSTPAEAHAIEAHVARCANCRQLLSRTSALLLSLPGGAPPSLSRSIGAAQSPALPAPRGRGRLIAPAVTVAVTVAVAVAVAVVVAVSLQRGRARTATPAARPSLA